MSAYDKDGALFSVGLKGKSNRSRVVFCGDHDPAQITLVGDVPKLIDVIGHDLNIKMKLCAGDHGRYQARIRLQRQPDAAEDWERAPIASLLQCEGNRLESIHVVTLCMSKPPVDRLPHLPLLLAVGWVAGIAGCGKADQAPTADQAPAETATAEIATANQSLSKPCADSGPVMLTHLGDGSTSYNYYVIEEYLRRHPGSPEQTIEIQSAQDVALRSSGEARLKPPSANLVESEFSHLLGAVMKSNAAIGAAVFDMHRLKVAASGMQLEAMVLPMARFKAVVKLGSSDPPYERQYSCPELAAMAKSCEAGTEIAGCWELNDLATNCKHGAIARYRPVLGYLEEGEAGVGVSMRIAWKPEPCVP